ncbi:MAG TPA: tetratricopeptide repeat protein [Planctomycetes bacterium]|nr:tetratricopeptide repeat protein [Planctomycetota bacterium]
MGSTDLPRDARLEEFLGDVCRLVAAGEYTRALAMLDVPREWGPGEVRLLFLRGAVCLELGLGARALEDFDRVLALDPGHAHAHHQRGLLRMAHGDLAGAREDFEAASRTDPTRGEFLRELAYACTQLEDPRGTVAAASKALRLLPRDAGIHAFLGWAQDMLGDRESAIRRYRRAIELDPRRTGDVYLLARLGGIEDPAGLEAWLEDPALSDVDRAAIGYALGEVRRRAGDHAGAFAAWDRAAHSFDPMHDPELRIAIADAIVEVSNADWFARPAGGDPTVAPVFIVGMPRSGSSLVERILGSHPAVHALGERTALPSLAVELGAATGAGRDFPGGLLDLSPEVEADLARRYLEEVRPDPSMARFTDKAPSNFQFLGLIARLFPNARILHTRRDPRDVALSCFSTWFGPNRCRFSYDLEHIAIYQRTHDQLMDHWHDVLPLPILEVDYEKLVLGGESAIRRIVEFVGLDWDPNCALFHSQGPTCFTASSNQVREPLHSRSIGRWRDYAPWLGEATVCS